MEEKKRLYVNLVNSNKNDSLISDLTENGFRRSFDHMYIPICENCNLCIPSRININKFTLSKSNKRNFKLNQDLQLTKASNVLKYGETLLNTVFKDIKIAKWVK